MKSSLNRSLLETTIRNSIKQIKTDPERSMRNLIDMALSFSNGRFQKQFLEVSQTMLKNENSCYYKIIPDLVTNADTERIVTFGINVGYNSCTLGAQTIRRIEAKEHFNIPWSIYLEMNGYIYYKNKAHYRSLLSNGKELGIYLWNIHSLDNPDYILELADKFDDCAFTISCSSDEITSSLLDNAKNIPNIMFIVEYGDNVTDACSLLRSRGFLYSISYSYKASDINEKTLDEILKETENQNAIFTVLSSPNPTSDSAMTLYKYISNTRTKQKYCTIPFDFIHDNNYIDHIISDQTCSIGFKSNGTCYSTVDNKVYENYNIFHNTIYDILKTLPSAN